MAKIKVPLRELSNLEVNWVSLVDRGANRIPFRIIKSDPTPKEPAMGINLSALKLGVRKQETPVAPTISAVILAKGDEALAGEARKVLTENGMDLPNTKVFEDGSLALFAADDYEEGGTLVRMNDQMAVVLKGFDPWAVRLDTLSFGEAAAARGYYDGLRSATNVLAEGVQQKLYKASTPSDAMTEVKGLLDGFNEYVEAMTRALPANVFKAEEAVYPMVSGWEQPVSPAAVAKADDKSAEGEVKPVVVVAKGDMEGAFKACGDCKDPAGCEKAGKCAGKPAETKKADEVKVEPSPMETAMEKLLGAVTGLTESMAGVQKSVTDLGTKVEKIESAQATTEERIAEVARKADDSARVIKSAVVSSEPAGDQDPTKTVRKFDGDPRTGVFDSALIPRKR